MPKALKKEVKYRCGELACRKIIRGDKWFSHCKSEHGFKLATGVDIKKRVIEIRKDGGKWEAAAATDSSQVCILLSVVVTRVLYLQRFFLFIETYTNHTP